MKKLILSLGSLAMAISLFSCSNDENSTNNKNLRLVAKATLVNPSNRTSSAISISEFQVNIGKIEFERDDNYFDDDNYGDGFYDDNDDISLRGPFTLNLLSGTTSITSLDLPNGIYKEVEFKMVKNTTPNNPLFNKSVVINGTINGTPFEFWHNDDEDFEIDYDDTNQNIEVTDNTATVTIDFDLSMVLAQVDLTQATDNDGDGIIEINPSDNDGNRDLADQIVDKLEEATELDD